MSYTCEYCDSVLSTTTNLRRHQRLSKTCLQIQGKYTKTTYKCVCNKIYLHVDSYNRHLKNCHIITQHKLVKCVYQDVLEKYEKFAEQALTTPKVVNNNNNVSLANLPPVTDDDIREHLNQLSINFIQEGAKGFAKFANSYPFKDKVICTDKSRKKLKYRDENGEIIDDNQGVKLAHRFFRTIASRNEELINTEYSLLQKQVQRIAENEQASVDNLPGILTKATQLQSLLIKCQEAAKGENNELTKEFIMHLSKMI